MAGKSGKPLNYKRVAIAGAGGIGGFVAANLYEYGALRSQFDFAGMSVQVFDDDIVDISNLLHQNFHEEDVGKYKAKLCAERYGMEAQVRFMEASDFKDFDLVFSCVDSMTFRNDLYKYGFDHPELTWIDGRCQSKAFASYNSSCPRQALETSLTDSKERKGCLLAVDKKNKVSHVTPQIVAGVMTQTFLNFIRGEMQQYPVQIML